MNTRTRFENELMDFLGERGYACLRSAGSRGPVDVLAIDKRSVRIIQVKSTYDFNRQGNTTIFRQAADGLLSLPCPPNTTKEIWVRVLRGGWRYIVLDECGAKREEILAYLKQPERWIQP